MSVGCSAWLWSCAGDPFSGSADAAGSGQGGAVGKGGNDAHGGASGQGYDSSTGGSAGATGSGGVGGATGSGGVGGSGGTATGGTSLIDAAKDGAGATSGGSGGTGPGGTGGGTADGGSVCGPQISCVDCCMQLQPDGANAYAIDLSACACTNTTCNDPCLILCAAGEVFVSDCYRCIDSHTECDTGRNQCASSMTCAAYSACIHACP